MSDDVEKCRAELERLGRLERLVDKYAQSRALGLWVGAVLAVMNLIVLVGSVELAEILLNKDTGSWWLVPIVLAWLWVLISIVGFVWFDKRRGYCFYEEKDGRIEPKRDRVPLWAWAAYIVSFLGATFLSAFDIMAIRWALTIALASLGVFVLYVGKKHGDVASAVVGGGLFLIEAAATAMGVPTPLANRSWMYSYFVPLTLYFAATLLVTAVAVHIYNRGVLREIWKLKPFGEAEGDRPVHGNIDRVTGD